MMGKRGDSTVVGVMFIFFLIILFLVWSVSYTNHECRSNNDCGRNSYCGSDFVCHDYPAQQAPPTSSGNSYALPALLIGICLIVAAYILRSKEVPGQRAIGPEHTPRARHETHAHEKVSQDFEEYGSNPHKKEHKHH